MAIQVEIWQSAIKEALFKSNEFIRYMKDADEFVVGGRIVHIPQSGGPVAVEKNRSTYPGTVVRRTDTDIVYTLDEYTTDPFHIPNADTVELSYDKTQSMIRENGGYLLQFTGDDLLYKALVDTPAGSKIPTTGANRTATAPGATGTRKTFTEAEIRAAQTLLNKQNVPKEGRYMILPSDFINDLMADNSLKYAFQNPVNLAEGVVAKLFGFNIVDRSSVLRVTSALAPKLPTAANATTDHNVAAFWHMDFVERAMGEINMYDNYGRAEYYGDIFSMLVRMGGRARREDNKGYGFIHEVPGV